MRRCLGLILALLMLLSLFVPAWAEAPADAENAVPAIFDNLVERLRANPRSLVFTEGTDARILEAAARLKRDGFLTPVLIGNADEVKAAADEGDFDIEGLEIIDPATYPDMEKLVDDFVMLRKGKATADQAREMLLKPNYFGGGTGRCPARRRDLLYRRHRATRAPVDQDAGRRKPRILLYDPHPRRREIRHG